MPERLRDIAGWAAAAVLGLAAIFTLQALLVSGTGEQQRQLDTARALMSGNPDRGLQIISATGCGACHVIPGVPGARGRVASPLQGVAGRNVIGGVLANTPDNLARWIENPRAINPATAMPNLGLTEDEARDVAAYLIVQAK